MHQSLEPHVLCKIVDRFPQANIPVVGDLMLDRFIWGDVQRISPEAPVPIVRVTRDSVHLGGALNVVANIRDLGGHATPVGLVGQDEAAEALHKLLQDQDISRQGLVTNQDFQTIQKTRIIAHNQQVVRVDREDDRPPCATLREQILTCLSAVADSAPSMIVSDYGKGVVDQLLLEELSKNFKKTNISIDPKDYNFEHYRHFHVITPNQKEAEGMAGVTIRDRQDAERAAAIIFANQAPDLLLMTRGEHGMILFRADGSSVAIPTRAREVFDVSGAGDTVIATYTMAETVGATPLQAAVLANAAAGVVVAKLGTATLSADELKQALRDNPLNEASL